MKVEVAAAEVEQVGREAWARKVAWPLVVVEAMAVAAPRGAGGAAARGYAAVSSARKEACH